MKYREVCSLREGREFSPAPPFKALPFHVWSLVDKGFSAMCSLFFPLLLFSQLCCVSFYGHMSWKGRIAESSRNDREDIFSQSGSLSAGKERHSEKAL